MGLCEAGLDQFQAPLQRALVLQHDLLRRLPDGMTGRLIGQPPAHKPNQRLHPFDTIPAPCLE